MANFETTILNLCRSEMMDKKRNIFLNGKSDKNWQLLSNETGGNSFVKVNNVKILKR